jgi:Amidohydrolase family
MIIKTLYSLLFSFIFSCHKPPKDPFVGARPAEDIDKSIVFLHANVITMENEVVLKDYSVFTHNGIITKIESTIPVAIPDSVFKIDATGMYLVPGLADMHTHIWYKDDILPYVANGITTVLHMGGPSAILQFRAEAANKQIISPTIWASGFVDGPGSRGWLATTPAEAEQVVEEIKSAGWDFVKVYNSIPSAAYAALMNKAREKNIPVIGHGVRGPGMQGVLTAGQVMIAHAEEYLYTHFNNTPDESLIPGAVSITKNAGAYVTPNLVTYETIAKQWGKPAGLQEMLAKPEMKYVSPKWKNNNWNQFDFTGRPGNIDLQYNFLKLFTKKLSDAGVPLLLGSDSPFMIGQANGFAIHDDLRNMIACGLTPYQALMAGTKTAGEFINKYVGTSKPFGLIKEGYKADLILLTANPLLNVGNVKKRAGVMINGRWLSEAKLMEEMEKLAKSF